MQGFNMGRYVPPEHEGTTSANKLAGKHALGNRARKAGQGILTVRFEMPFPIWCSTCPKPTIIGQGVRFNAEKKKVGNYHTTPIFSFRMKHNVCGGWIEIRTDPQNTAYVVTEGAKKRDTGEDKQQDGEIIIRTDEERERLRNDAFAALEVKIDDRRKAKTDKTRIEELQNLREKDWEDPYAASMKLRRAFRADRKVREKNAVSTENLKDRMSLGMDLLEETEADRKRASFVDFGDVGGETAIVKAKIRPLFARELDSLKRSGKRHKNPKKAKTMLETESRREKLRRELGDNTRAAVDPFLSFEKPRDSPKSTELGIKRKMAMLGSEKAQGLDEGKRPNESSPVALVDYESD
ncbi:MAG: hypothetical protein FRX48_03194 [Lasallia pustulata]|uniref:CWC16 protein n=1 Tax=Lasallia pustulata TaxID=136370 RepID=A0A5M8PUX1_9LECA|nr:MAG: hypothetical protein FRX48_03194 [Lasallia pustulata]